MNLNQVCHPLFQYICSLYRHQENGQVPPEDNVRADVRHCFESMRDSVLGNTILSDQLSKMELPLVFFVDYMIKEGPFEFSQTWVELARDFNELSGDEKFFDMLDDTLADPAPSATERISTFYTCIALGFYGCYASDPYYLERKIKICALRTGLDGGDSLRQQFGASVYKTVLREKRFKDPGRAARPFLLVALIVLISVIVVNLVHYNMLVNKTRKRFYDIVNPRIAESQQKSQPFFQISQTVVNAPQQQNQSTKLMVAPEPSPTKNKVRQYPQDAIRQASWFPAYEAGTKLNERYDVRKNNSKKSEKGVSNPPVPTQTAPAVPKAGATQSSPVPAQKPPQTQSPPKPGHSTPKPTRATK
ncbi:MAG: hypothetical protein GXP32_09570 [Kiritimatiellaeota bacterium]|nr:hypothetical protein [Kiritimatiellota bacterium]